MSVLRAYEKNGSEVFSNSFGNLPSGQFDYLGGGHYIVGTQRGALWNMNLNGTVWRPVKQLATLSAQHQYAGVTINHSYLEENQYDGTRIFVLDYGPNDSPSATLNFRVYDLEGNKVHNDTLLSVGALAAGTHGMTFNGDYIAIGITSSGPTNQVRLYELAKKALNLNKIYGQGGQPVPDDFCFDGVYTWYLEGSTVKQKEITTSASTVNFWTANGSGHIGIATDGNLILILSSS